MTSITKKIQYKGYSHRKFKDCRNEVKRFLDEDEELRLRETASRVAHNHEESVRLR